jgi:hypothetical protein
MATGKTLPDDDYGDLDIRKKHSGSNSTLFIVLACGIIGLVLLTCVAGGVIMMIVDHHDRGVPPQAREVGPGQDPEAAKLNGTWKGRFVLNGQQRDHLYTFRKDGTMREEEFDQFGKIFRASEARWRFRNGQVEIDWGAGGKEIATARWFDNNSFEYHIIQHTDGAQVGMKETFRRQ